MCVGVQKGAIGEKLRNNEETCKGRIIIKDKAKLRKIA